MGSFHQMGHDSENLLDEPELTAFAGAVLSPVNYDPQRTRAQIERFQTSTFRMVLDPQMYYPRSQRGQLREWPYFPSDVDTADLSSQVWWQERVDALASTATEIGVNAVCSPATAPRTFTATYYEAMLWNAARLREALPADIAMLATLIVNGRDMADRNRCNELASMVSGQSFDECYIVCVADVDPRYELIESSDIAGFMRLIGLLEDSGIKVLVSHCSSDVVLWKRAGATSCATGKFFNLRRFTSSRFDPPTRGGGALPYYFEESLFAFLREADLLRVRTHGLVSDASRRNPLTEQILSSITGTPRRPWTALSWRQYLWWFSDFEARATSNPQSVVNQLLDAQNNWTTLNARPVVMEEATNDGRWVPRWREANRLFEADLA